MAAARELRFAFTFDDYEAALALFRDVFELETIMDLDTQGARGVILRVPSATLEVFDRGQGRLVDDIEGPRPLKWCKKPPHPSTRVPSLARLL